MCTYASHRAHVAGTPLGDPIELGAISTAFGQAQRPAPIALMASKGFLGHTEPAAGVVSLIMAANSLAHTAQFPVMHLRTLNSHVDAILGASPGVVALPRASGGLPHGATHQASDAHMCTGISSFAFQGTNAHAILQAAPRTNTQTDSQVRMQWQQQRRWVLPQAHCLIRQCLSAGKHGDITFAVNMQQPNLAFLWEHQVLGRSIFPAAGYAEVALAGLRCLADATTAVVCLQAVAIPAPLLLAPAGSDGGQTITCCINTHKQQVSIASVGVSSSGETVHMHSHFGLLPDSTTASTAQNPSAALTGLLASLAEERVDSGDESQQQQAAAQGMIAPSLADAQQGFWHHPASFDSFLQLGQLFLPNTLGSTPGEPPSSIHVPAGVDCLSLPCRLDTRQQSYGSCQPAGEALTCNYALYSSQAQSSCVISGMRAKPLVTHASAKETAEASATNAQLLYETVWLAEEELHHSQDGISTSSSNRLHLSDANPAMACANALAVMQNCLTAGPDNMDSMLTLQYGRASDSTAQSANAVAGALRTAAIECNLPATVISTNTYTSSFSSQKHGVQLSLQQPNSTADAFGKQHSAGISMVPRLLPSRDASTPAAFTMLPQPRGALANLKPAALSASSMTQLQPGQVLLRVHAVGVNFRDVLNVLGMYPGDPGAPGADCAGIVAQGLRNHLLESFRLV